MKPLSSLLFVFLLGACAGPPEPLIVKQCRLRDANLSPDSEPMTRMEQELRLHGAVSMAERNQHLGQYFTLQWSDPTGVGHGAVEAVFQYQQGATAGLIKHLSQTFPATAAQGRAEFAIIGNNYFKGGKVLAWKATVRRGGRNLATRQSYLWQ